MDKERYTIFKILHDIYGISMYEFRDMSEEIIKFYIDGMMYLYEEKILNQGG
jgi:hypothetical protein